MAEFINPIGKIRGKFGNVIPYVGKNGKNYCRSTSLERKAVGEGQKRQSVAFGTTASRKRWLTSVIRLGFPGGNGYPQGFYGFTSANVTHAVSVEKIHPEIPVNRRKKATQEFQGTIDYGKLRVAAGQLVIPIVNAEIDTENRKVSFTSPGILFESVDCFMDDRIYAALLYEPKHRCLVKELGKRGEILNTTVDFPRDATADKLIIYVFAKNADGKDVSDSVCLQKPEQKTLN